MAKEKTELLFQLRDEASAGLQKIKGELGGIVTAAGRVTTVAAGLGAALAAVGGAIVVGQLKEGAKTAADLEGSFNRLRGVTGASAEQVARFRGEIERLAQGAAVSTSEAVGTVEQLARAGLSASEAVGALGPALNLAAASAMSNAEAAGLLADTLDQFGLSGDKAAEVADKLAAAALKSGTGVGQMADAFRTVAPFARQAGLSFDQVAAALGLLAKQGLEGGQAGKGLRSLLGELADGTSQVSTSLKSAGVDVKSFGDVLKFLGSNSTSAQAAVASLSDQGKAALAALLREGGGNLQALIGILQQSEGSAKQVADTINSGFNKAFERFKNTLSELRAKVAEPLLKPLADALDELAAKLLAFSQSPEFQKLQESLGALFKKGTEAALEFVEGIEFSEVLADVQAFVDDAGAKFEALSATLSTVGAAIGATVDGIQLLFSGFKTGVAALALGVTTLLQESVRLFTPFSEKARESFGELQEAAKRFKAELDKGVAETNQRLREFSAAAAKAKTEAAALGAAAGQTAEQLAKIKAQEMGLTGALPGTTLALKRQADAIADLNEKAAKANVADLTERLANLHEELIRAQDLGASGTVLQDLELQIDKTKRELNEATEAARALKKEVSTPPTNQEQLDAWAEETKRRAQEVIDAQKRIAAGWKEAGEAAEEFGQEGAKAQQTVVPPTAQIMGILQSLREAYLKVSVAAADSFKETYNAIVRGALNLKDVGDAIEEADKITQRRLADQRAQLEGLIGLYGELADTGRFAGEEVGKGAFASAEALRQFAQRVRDGKSQIDLLGQADLSRLGAAIDAVAAKIDAVKEKAAAAIESLGELNRQLQDQLDREDGNERAIEERRFQDELQRIAELAAAAGQAGAAAAADARRRAEELHRRRLEQIAEEAQARRAAESGGGGGGSGAGAGGFGAPGGAATTSAAPGPRRPATDQQQSAPAAGFTMVVNVSGVVAGDLEEFGKKLTPVIDRQLRHLLDLRR